MHDRLDAVAVNVSVTEVGAELSRTGIDRFQVEPSEPTHAMGAQRFEGVHPGVDERGRDRAVHRRNGAVTPGVRDERRVGCEARADACHVVGGTGWQLLLDTQGDCHMLQRIAGNQRRADPVVEQQVQQTRSLGLVGQQLVHRRAESGADPAAQ